MLSEPELGATLSGVKPLPLRGLFSRCVGYHLLSSTAGGASPTLPGQPLWGMGAQAFGGRFTPKGGFETIYLAEDPITSLAEVALVIQHSSIPPRTLRTPPWVHIAVEGILLSTLDLTQEHVMAQLKTNAKS